MVDYLQMTQFLVGADAPANDYSWMEAYKSLTKSKTVLNEKMYNKPLLSTELCSLIEFVFCIAVLTGRKVHELTKLKSQ